MFCFFSSRGKTGTFSAKQTIHYKYRHTWQVCTDESLLLKFSFFCLNYRSESKSMQKWFDIIVCKIDIFGSVFFSKQSLSNNGYSRIHFSYVLIKVFYLSFIYLSYNYQVFLFFWVFFFGFGLNYFFKHFILLFCFVIGESKK